MRDAVKIVIDHVKGSRRGQRQEFGESERLSIGRHPRNDVSFDAHRDLDASARHAEVRRRDGGFVLTDVGSSNGTFVDGSRVSEVPLELGQPVVVEFGAGGPQLRIWVGEGEASPAPVRRSRPGLGLVLATALVAAGLGYLLWFLAR